MFQKSLLILSLVLLSVVSGMRYDPKQASSKSLGTNTVTLPLIDDSTVSITYQTDCKDCECSVVSPLATVEKLKETEFSKEIKQVYTADNIIYVIHQGESETVYFSAFSVDKAGSLTTIFSEQQKGPFKNAENIYFNHHNGAFIEYIQDKIVIVYADSQGKFAQEKVFTYATKDDIYDMVVLNNKMIIAKGEKGIEVLDISTNNIKSEEFWLEDLELHSDAEVTGLGVDTQENIVYILAPRNAGGMEVELIRFLSLDDVILVNKYELNVGEVVGASHSDKRTGVVSHLGDKSYYWQFFTPERNGNLTLWSQLEIPFKAEDLVSDDHCSMIEGNDYVYTFENGFPGDQSLDISMNIIEVEEDGYYQPLILGEESYLLSYIGKTLKFFRTSKDNAEYQCRVDKQDYAGNYKFNLLVEKSVCPEYEKKYEGETCLFPYEYNVEFTGSNFMEKEVSPYQPQNLPLKVIREPAPPKGPSGGHSGMPDMPDIPVDYDESDDSDDPIHGGSSHGGHNQPTQPTQPTQGGGHGTPDQSSHGGGHGSHDIPDIAPRNWKPRVDYKREIMMILANPVFIGVMAVLLVFMVYQIWRIWKARQFTHQELKEDEEADSGRPGTMELESKDDEQSSD